MNFRCQYRHFLSFVTIFRIKSQTGLFLVHLSGKTLKTTKTPFDWILNVRPVEFEPRMCVQRDKLEIYIYLQNTFQRSIIKIYERSSV